MRRCGRAQTRAPDWVGREGAWATRGNPVGTLSGAEVVQVVVLLGGGEAHSAQLLHHNLAYQRRVGERNVTCWGWRILDGSEFVLIPMFGGKDPTP